MAAFIHFTFALLIRSQLLLLPGGNSHTHSQSLTHVHTQKNVYDYSIKRTCPYIFTSLLLRHNTDTHTRKVVQIAWERKIYIYKARQAQQRQGKLAQSVTVDNVYPAGAQRHPSGISPVFFSLLSCFCIKAGTLCPFFSSITSEHIATHDYIMCYLYLF